MKETQEKSESESHSLMSNSLRPHGIYSPWNSPGQNTGVGSHSLLQWIFLTQESNRGLLHCRGILYQLSYRGSPRDPGDTGSIPGLGRSPRDGNGNPLQNSCLENFMDIVNYGPRGHKQSDKTKQLSMHARMHSCLAVSCKVPSWKLGFLYSCSDYHPLYPRIFGDLKIFQKVNTLYPGRVIFSFSSDQSRQFSGLGFQGYSGFSVLICICSQAFPLVEFLSKAWH